MLASSRGPGAAFAVPGLPPYGFSPDLRPGTDGGRHSAAPRDQFGRPLVSEPSRGWTNSCDHFATYRPITWPPPPRSPWLPPPGSPSPPVTRNSSLTASTFAPVSAVPRARGGVLPRRRVDTSRCGSASSSAPRERGAVPAPLARPALRPPPLRLRDIVFAERRLTAEAAYALRKGRSRPGIEDTTRTGLGHLHRPAHRVRLSD